MSSLPGLPGSLGLPSGDPSNSDSSFDVPVSDGTSITIANRTFYPPEFGSPTSGSFAIPGTTSGNLLVILVATEQRGEGDPSPGFRTALAISDDAGDVFTQVPWYGIVGSGATGLGTEAEEAAHAADPAGSGFMANFASPGFPDVASAGPGFAGSFDAWYAVTNGGATAITYAMSPEGLGPVFWVYELIGTDWQLIDFGVGLGTEFAYPYVGPALSGTGAHNVYFSLINTNSFQSRGTVSSPWVLDPSGDTLDGDPYGASLGYILDSSGAGVQQATFSASDGPDWYTSLGVAFSGTPGTNPPPPPPPPSGGPQPNVCLIC
jgi:hypothetical protein